MSVTNEVFVSEYLERIHYQGGLVPCRETLMELHRCHTTHVLFENLNLLKEGFKANLSRDYLFDKIVRQHRGGVCYELNTSFYLLLNAMGFDVQQVCGIVRPGETEFDHVATWIHLDEGDFLADVGLGNTFMPVQQINAVPSAMAGNATYTMKPLGDAVYEIIRRRPGQDDEYIYTIYLIPQTQDAFFPRFDWASTMGHTKFSSYPIVGHFTAEREMLLRGKVFTIQENGVEVENIPITCPEDSARILREYFNLP